MPNRFIKESICTSEDIELLSPMAEILFYRLIVNADDFGRFFANPSIVKSNCFPLKSDELKLEQVDNWLRELENAGLIIRYVFENRKYLQFCKWEKHQSKRAKSSKFPPPDCDCTQMKTDENACKQMSPYSYSYSYSGTNSEQKESASKPIFRPPTLDEVEDYCQKNGFTATDPDTFMDFYSAKGWKIGGDAMEDWYAALRRWEAEERKRMKLPSLREQREAEKKKKAEAADLVEYPVGSGRRIPRNQARQEANLHGDFVEHPPGSGEFIPVYEYEELKRKEAPGSDGNR